MNKNNNNNNRKNVSNINNDINNDNSIIDDKLSTLSNDLKFETDDIDLEMKLTKQIKSEIRKFIYKSTIKTIAAFCCIIIVGLFVVNPLIKMKYPNYFVLNTPKYDKLSIWNKFIIRFLGKTPQFADFEYDKDFDEPSKLDDILYQFYSTTDPFVEFGGINVIDNQFGNYEFYIDHLNRYAGHVSAGDVDKVVKYKRGVLTQEQSANNLPYQPLFPKDYFSDSGYNDEILKRIEELPDSSRLTVSIYTKKLEPIKDLIQYMNKNHSNVNLMWLPVIDKVEYNRLLAFINTKDKNKYDPQNVGFKIFPFGLNASNQSVYQKDFDTLTTKIDSMSNADLKSYFVKKLDNIEKNIDILHPFNQSPIISIDYYKDHKTFSSGYGTSLTETIKMNIQNEFNYDSGFYDYKNYKENILKVEKLETNMFTTNLTKKELLKLVKDNKFLSLEVEYVETNTLGWTPNN